MNKLGEWKVFLDWLQKQLVEISPQPSPLQRKDGGKLEFDYAVFDACEEFEGNDLVEFTLERA